MSENFGLLYSTGTVLETRVSIDILDRSDNIKSRLEQGTHYVIFLAVEHAEVEYYGLRSYNIKNRTLDPNDTRIYLEREHIEDRRKFEPLGRLNLDKRQIEWKLFLAIDGVVPPNFLIPSNPTTRH